MYAIHDEILKRSQILEISTIDFLHDKKELNREDYLKIVEPSKYLVKAGLEKHFRFEEAALYPMLMERSPKARRLVLDLISEHTQFMQRFKNFETVEDYDGSIRTLTALLKDISLHAGKENVLYSSTSLTNSELSKVTEIAHSIGYPID